MTFNQIRLKYSLKSAGLTLLDGTKNLLCQGIQLIGMTFMVYAFCWLLGAKELYPNDRAAAWWEAWRRMPLAYSLNTLGWAILLLGKLLRTPNGWRQCRWQEFLLNSVLPGSARAMGHLITKAREIDLEARLRQEDLHRQLTEKERAEIAYAAQTAARARALRQIIQANQRPGPRYGYLASFAVVLAGLVIHTSIGDQQRASVEETVSAKRFAITASVAKTATCHPPPAHQLEARTLVWSAEQPWWRALPPWEWPPDPPPEELSLRRRIWDYLGAVSDPPARSIDHIPEPSAQLRRFIVA